MTSTSTDATAADVLSRLDGVRQAGDSDDARDVADEEGQNR